MHFVVKVPTPSSGADDDPQKGALPQAMEPMAFEEICFPGIGPPGVHAVDALS